MLRTPMHANRPAHHRVTADAARATYTNNGTYWPVSGDETPRAIGYTGMRDARNAYDVWESPAVKAGPTAGIRVGLRITLWGGETGTVTRVGSIAGFMLNRHGEEVRWDAADVQRIERPLTLRKIAA